MRKPYHSTECYMNVDIKDTTTYRDFSGSDCEVNCIHVRITDLNAVVTDLTAEISDTSWIPKLDRLSQKTFKATSDRTIDRVVNEIFSGVITDVTADIGEYVVSYVGQSVLVSHFTHIKIPLAELLKEKIIGNPGFDFHTVSSKRFLVFGEAKFSGDDTPRAIALNQIGDFIKLEKDYAELNSIRAFLETDTHDHMVDGRRGFAAAFSFNASDIDLIFRNALKSDIIDDLTCHNELYLIAIEIVNA